MKYTNPMKVFIHLTNVEEIKDFNHICENMDCDIDASIDKYTVDAKSIMGLMSLDCSKNICVTVYTDDEDILDTFLLRISKWLEQI